MSKKHFLLSAVLYVLLFFGLTGEVLGDASEQFEQAGAHEKNKEYDQAEQIYQQILASSPDANDALEAQTRLTCLYVAAERTAEAEAAFAKLTADFAGHKHIANSVWEVGLKYKNAGKLDKAEEIHRHNVANFAAHKDAMWSQVEIVYSRIAQGDNGGADAAVDELLSVFSGQATLPKEIHQIAKKYNQGGSADKALEFWNFNVAQFPEDKYAMWSQVRIFHSLMAKGDDSGADAAVEKLLGVFSEQATLPREIHQIGGAYAKAKRRDRALELWNYNVEKHPNDKFAMWSQVRTVYSHIQDGNDTAADTAAGRLLSVFLEEPTLSREIRQVAKRFGRAGMAGKAVELHTYNVDNFPKSEEAMGSQLDIVDYYLGDGNDPNGAAMAANRLVSVFSEQKGLAGKVYEIAGRLAEGGRADDAIGLYEYNVENSAEDANGLLSQVEIAYINIDKKDAAGIDAAVDKLVTAFAGREGLTKQIVRVGRRLYSGGYRDEALALHRYNIEQHPDDQHAMWSQVETIYAHIRDPNASEAVVDAEVDKLLNDFAAQDSIAREVRLVGKALGRAGRAEKALQLHEYNVETHPGAVDAMWSQVDMFEMHVGDGNDLMAEDWAVADGAVEKLLSAFAGNPKLVRAIRQVGKGYNAAGRSDKALELWGMNVDNSPNNVDAMLSQMDIIYSHIDPNDGNDAAVDAEVEKLLAVFSAQPSLPQKVYYIGNRYRNIAEYDRAIHFYQLVGEKWPQDDLALTSRVEIGKVNIQLGDDEGVTAVIDDLIADYNEHPRLPWAVFVLGEEYYNVAIQAEKEARAIEAGENFTKAIAIWDIIIEGLPVSLPDTAHAWYFSAVSYRRMGEYGNAIFYYQEVVDNWPGYQYAWSAQCLIGGCFEKLQKSGALPEAEAEPLIEQAYTLVIENYPECSLAGHACLKLAEMNLKKGRKLEAAGYYELFLTAAPADPRVKSVKARLERLGGQSK